MKTVKRARRARGDGRDRGQFRDGRARTQQCSDLDVIVVVAESDEPFVRRAAGFDTGELPVPAAAVVRPGIPAGRALRENGNGRRAGAMRAKPESTEKGERRRAI